MDAGKKEGLQQKESYGRLYLRHIQVKFVQGVWIIMTACPALDKQETQQSWKYYFNHQHQKHG